RVVLVEDEQAEEQDVDEDAREPDLDHAVRYPPRVDEEVAPGDEGLVVPGEHLVGHSFLISGNSSTSRIDGWPVSSMTRRSMPTPSPAVGGMPTSSARQ